MRLLEACMRAYSKRCVRCGSGAPGPSWVCLECERAFDRPPWQKDDPLFRVPAVARDLLIFTRAQPADITPAVLELLSWLSGIGDASISAIMRWAGFDSGPRGCSWCHQAMGGPDGVKRLKSHNIWPPDPSRCAWCWKDVVTKGVWRSASEVPGNRLPVKKPLPIRRGRGGA